LKEILRDGIMERKKSAPPYSEEHREGTQSHRKDEEIMESCSCGKYQYGDEAKLPDPAWQYVKEGFMGTVYKCCKCGCLWFKTISSGIIGMPIYIKSKPDADFGKPSPASDVRLEDLLVKK